MTYKYHIVYDDPEKGAYDSIYTNDPQVILDFLTWHIGGVMAEIKPKTVSDGWGKQ